MVKTQQEVTQRIVQYAQDIIANKIESCEKHKGAARIFMRLYQDEQIEFKTDLVYKIYMWATLFQHTKGAIANTPIFLTDFQLFLIANIFAFYKNGVRLRKQAYIQVARKQAKSQILSVISTYFFFNSAEIEEIYIAGAQLDQSRLIYEEIDNQLQRSPLKNSYKSYQKEGYMHNKKTGSRIKPLSKHAKKTGDGTNPSLSIIDEFHSHADTKIRNILWSGMGARKEPILITITTAGKELNCPCKLEYDYASQVAKGEIVKDDYFALICEMESEEEIHDETKWIKANPIGATNPIMMQNLRDMYSLAVTKKETDPDDYHEFLTKQMNIWVQGNKHNAFIHRSEWDNLTKIEDVTLLHDKECVIGVDIASCDDLTAISWVVPLDDGNFFVDTHCFIPREVAVQKMATNKDKGANYLQWEKDGYITLVDNPVVDYETLIDYILKMPFQTSEICYDGWGAAQFVNRIEENGKIAITVHQGMSSLSVPTKELKYAIKNRRIVVSDNPILKWCMLNAQVMEDTSRNIKLTKGDRHRDAGNKIDCAAALVNAFSRIEIQEKTLNVWGIN